MLSSGVFLFPCLRLSLFVVAAACAFCLSGERNSSPPRSRVLEVSWAFLNSFMSLLILLRFFFLVEFGQVVCAAGLFFLVVSQRQVA